MALATGFYYLLRLSTGLLTVATDCTGRLLSSKCYSVRLNFFEEAHVSNLVVFIGMGNGTVPYNLGLGAAHKTILILMLILILILIPSNHPQTQ
jgi:hypothetical protein